MGYFSPPEPPPKISLFWILEKLVNGYPWTEAERLAAIGLLEHLESLGSLGVVVENSYAEVKR